MVIQNTILVDIWVPLLYHCSLFQQTPKVWMDAGLTLKKYETLHQNPWIASKLCTWNNRCPAWFIVWLCIVWLSRSDNINTVGHMMFKEKYAPKEGDDPFNKIKGLNPITTPPCQRSLSKKIKRANVVAYMWKKACTWCPITYSPVKNR